MDDLPLVEKLIGRYRRAFREEHYAGLWKKIFDRHHRQLHAVLMEGSVEACAAVLRDPVQNGLHFGFGSESNTHNDTALLRQLSVALGAERLENPEDSLYARRRVLGVLRRTRQSLESAETILSRIDVVLQGVDFPNPFPGEGGLVTRRGKATDRAINAVYQASLLKGKVLEIGGGVGRTAYYAHRFGVTDYTIVDLPFSGISQGYFLGRVLGEHEVKLMSPDEFFASDERYDVVLNADSLTEIARPTAEKYAAEIRRRATRLISINHEGNAFTVRELLGRPLARHLYWLRDGYVEETYQSP